MLKEISKYWTASSGGYDKVVQSQFKSKKTVAIWKELLEEGLGDRLQQQVLDVGTGPGFFSILLSQMGHRPTAVDASPGMIKVAMANFEQFGFKIPASVGDAAKLDHLPDQSMDAVVCRDVVWTLPEPQQAYAEWYRVLKPGGKVIVFDGNYLYQENKSLFYKLWYALSWTLILVTERRVRRRGSSDQELLNELPFVHVLRPEADENALRMAGFRIINIRRNFIPPRRQLLNHLKYGVQTAQRFMIIATKE